MEKIVFTLKLISERQIIIPIYLLYYLFRVFTLLGTMELIIFSFTVNNTYAFLFYDWELYL